MREAAGSRRPSFLAQDLIGFVFLGFGLVKFGLFCLGLIVLSCLGLAWLDVTRGLFGLSLCGEEKGARWRGNKALSRVKDARCARLSRFLFVAVGFFFATRRKKQSLFASFSNESRFCFCGRCWVTAVLATLALLRWVPGVVPVSPTKMPEYPFFFLSLLSGSYGAIWAVTVFLFFFNTVIPAEVWAVIRAGGAGHSSSIRP